MRFLVLLLGVLLFALGYGQTLAFPHLRQVPVICLDPGHESERGVGTRGKKTSELHVVWEIAKVLEKKLRKNGMAVVMTKAQENQKVTNKTRALIGNYARADLMVRLHCDAGTGSGFATYYPDQTVVLPDRVGPLKSVIDASRRAAYRFHPVVVRKLRGHLSDAGIHTEADTYWGKKQGALTGSIYSDRPVILLEICVLQNPKDEEQVATPQGRDRVAEAIRAGIVAVVR